MEGTEELLLYLGHHRDIPPFHSPVFSSAKSMLEIFSILKQRRTFQICIAGKQMDTGRGSGWLPLVNKSGYVRHFISLYDYAGRHIVGITLHCSNSHCDIL